MPALTVFLVMIGFQNCGHFKAQNMTALSSKLGANNESLSSFAPDALFLGGGTITISGKGFVSATTVTIDGQDCSNLQIVSDTQLKCSAPALPAGPHHLAVSGAEFTQTLRYADFSQVVSVAGRSGLPDNIDGVGRLARIFQISGMASDGKKIYFTDYRYHVVRSMDLDTFEVKTIAGTAGTSGFADGVGLAAKFSYPTSIAAGGGALYIGDWDNCALRKVNLSTMEVTTLASHGDGSSACPVADGAAATAKTGKVASVIVKDGTLITAEKGTTGYVIRSFDLQTQTYATLFGDQTKDSYDWTVSPAWAQTGGVWTHNMDAAAADALVGTVGSLTVAGNKLYFADDDAHAVRSYDFTTHQVVALFGANTYDLAIGAPQVTDYGSVAGLATDGSILYVADYGRYRILRVNIATRQSSVLFQIPPGGGDPASIDGPLATANMIDAFNLVFDAARGLFFDSQDVIRQIK